MNAQKKVVYLDRPTDLFDVSPTSKNINIILEKNGFEIVHTGQTDKDIHIVCRETPDVVLLDMSDNQKSVWELYYQIRQSTHTCNIPVILITDKAARIEDVLQLYAANAADCLMEPFAPQELLASINHALLN